MRFGNPTRVRAIAFSLGVLTLSSISPVIAQSIDAKPVIESSAEDKVSSLSAFDIAARSDRSDSGFGASMVDARMVLTNASGQTSERELSIRTLEKKSEDTGDKSLVLFRSPNDIRGTALLSHTNILKQDDQWLYLPSIKRVKRISSANKSGPFVGSEFAFEDFTASELNKYEYALAGEEVIARIPCDVLERKPLYDRSGYTRQKVWIDKVDFQIRKIEFYDRRNDLLKTLTLSEYRKYSGVWRAHELSMTNHQTGKSTSIYYGEFDFTVDLNDNDFSRGALARSR